MSPIDHNRLEQLLISVEKICGPDFIFNPHVLKGKLFNSKINELIEILGLKTEKELALLLELDPEEINEARENKVIPKLWLRKLKSKYILL